MDFHLTTTPKSFFFDGFDKLDWRPSPRTRYIFIFFYPPERKNALTTYVQNLWRLEQLIRNHVTRSIEVVNLQ